MKVFILAIFLVCTWAQYNVNLCDLTRDCSGGAICRDAGVGNFPSDRSGYTCSTDTKKCVAPQCSHYSYGYVDAFAKQCDAGLTCTDKFVCAASPPVAPQPQKPKDKIDLGVIGSAGMTGDYCTSSWDCTIGYCDTLNHKCKDKKPFSPLCPANCTVSEECYEGSCDTYTSLKCARTSYKRNVGDKCSSNLECFSNECTQGLCTGTDCTTFVNYCPANWFCDYEYQNTPGGYFPNCFPNFEDFTANCDLTTHFAKRETTTSFVCVAKLKADATCDANYECESGWCNSAQCASYAKDAIPEGKSCQTGFCKTGLVCNSGKICVTGSLTVGKPCRWDSAGYHNCSVNFSEKCVCYSGGPKCVSTGDTEYRARLQSYYPSSGSSVDNAINNAINDAYTKISLCFYDAFHIDTDEIKSLPSVLTGSYYRSQSDTGCDYNSIGFKSDPKCLPDVAKYYCCYMCTGLTQAYLESYPNIDKDAKIFYSPVRSPVLSITCGAEPKIQFDRDSCSSPQLDSLNNILPALNCDGTPQPSYSKVSVSITVPGGTDTTNYAGITQIITDLLKANGYETPTYITSSTDPDNANTVIITLIYGGDKNDQSNLDSAQKTLSSDEFSDKVSTVVPGATVSNVAVQGSGAQSVVLSMISLIVFVLIGLLF